MARRGKGNGRTGGKNRIMNVRMTDSAAGSDGLKVDRQVAAMKTSESQTRVLIGDVFDVAVNTAVTTGTYGWDQLLSTDEFQAFVQQYNLFRVVSMKFDVYDINSTLASYNVFGTWHDNYETTAPAYTRANISDLPDSRVVVGGSGHETLYWSAHGVAERQFQAAAIGGSPVQKYGGLKFWLDGAASAAAKFTIQVHAVVDFRGRR